jgi:hypothetical protein
MTFPQEPITLSSFSFSVYENIWCKSVRTILNSALGCFLCVRIDVFLVSSDGSVSLLEQVLHHWFPDPSLRAIMSQFGQCQLTPGVVVPDDGDERRLLKRLTIRAYRIIHGRSQGTPCKNSFVKRLVRGAQ